VSFRIYFGISEEGKFEMLKQVQHDKEWWKVKDVDVSFRIYFGISEEGKFEMLKQVQHDRVR